MARPGAFKAKLKGTYINKRFGKDNIPFTITAYSNCCKDHAIYNAKQITMAAWKQFAAECPGGWNLHYGSPDSIEFTDEW